MKSYRRLIEQMLMLQQFLKIMNETIVMMFRYSWRNNWLALVDCTFNFLKIKPVQYFKFTLIIIAFECYVIFYGIAISREFSYGFAFLT
uniref:Uncharacterized protein n=1 Tax=Glossina palpalis gambiensis TaxID=67801 RepID=A0A1B0BY98_9MUSC